MEESFNTLRSILKGGPTHTPRDEAPKPLPIPIRTTRSSRTLVRFDIPAKRSSGNGAPSSPEGSPESYPETKTKPKINPKTLAAPPEPSSDPEIDPTPTSDAEILDSSVSPSTLDYP
ncbi:hypothetical protein QBC39DRAFT_335388 [Podospora conica]|nr:hypothetical protein QBC39DRAFT_335388 [Schizothecium conicum]